MEAFEEAIAASKEQSLILKGKRTKRQRPQSPIPFSISPPIVEEEVSNVLDSREYAVETGKKDGVITSSSSSASWSSNNNPTLKAEEDEEDQDIANALGGHRASHKKPRATSFYSNLDLKKSIYENDAASLVTTVYNNNKNNNNRSLVAYGKAGNNKVHECGICGAEFTSGQALGGHMRRHRGAVVVTAAPAPIVTVATAAANTELSLSSMSYDQISDGQDHLVMPETKKAKKTVVSLDLDLNLPAPEDENRVNELSLALKQKTEQEHQQTEQREEPMSLVLSAPTFVDCYY
ncbi:hypothetical protein Bca4012_015950 [Brassica carinata]